MDEKERLALSMDLIIHPEPVNLDKTLFGGFGDGKVELDGVGDGVHWHLLCAGWKGGKSDGDRKGKSDEHHVLRGCCPKDGPDTCLTTLAAKLSFPRRLQTVEMGSD